MRIFEKQNYFFYKKSKQEFFSTARYQAKKLVLLISGVIWLP